MFSEIWAGFAAAARETETGERITKTFGKRPRETGDSPDPRQNWIEGKSRLKHHEAAQPAGHEANVGFCGPFDHPSRRGPVDGSFGNLIVVGLRATNSRCR